MLSDLQSAMASGSLLISITQMRAITDTATAIATELITHPAASRPGSNLERST